MCVHSSIHSSILPFVHPSIRPSFHSSIHSSILPLVHLLVHPLVHPSIRLSFHSSILPLVHPFVRPSITSFPSSDIRHILPEKRADFLLGKDRKACLIPIDNISCSKQHAVIHFRRKPKAPDTIAPYILDLESTNGTFLNGEKLEAGRYYELKAMDKLNFANSTRDYIVMKA